MFFEEAPGEGWAGDLPVDAIVDTMIARALQDAQQTVDVTLQAEARAWLWVCCPDLADQMGLPAPEPAGAWDAVAAYSHRHR